MGFGGSLTFQLSDAMVVLGEGLNVKALVRQRLLEQNVPNSAPKLIARRRASYEKPDFANQLIGTINPLSATFSDDAVEREYRASAFEGQHSLVLVFCAVMLASDAAMCVVFPKALPVLGAGGVFFFVVGAVRLGVRRLADRERAIRLWSWCVFAASSLVGAAFSLVQRRFVLVQGLSASNVVWLSFWYTNAAAFGRIIIPLPLPRLLALAALVIMWASFPSPGISELGQPQEALLIGACMLVGELFGHSFELLQRRAHLETHTLSGGS